MTENNDRQRGVSVYPMPAEVSGPFDNYALLVRENGELRMVHTEGVAYEVSVDKTWKWNDYDPTVKSWTTAELVTIASRVQSVDLADWVRTFGARLESNFHQIWWWATELNRVEK